MNLRSPREEEEFEHMFPVEAILLIWFAIAPKYNFAPLSFMGVKQPASSAVSVLHLTNHLITKPGWTWSG